MTWTVQGMAFLKVYMLLHLAVLSSSSNDIPRLRLKVDSYQSARLGSRHQHRVMSLLANHAPLSVKTRRHLGIKHNYTPFDTPSVRLKGYMFCKTGFLLEIDHSGRVTGTSNMTSPNALLEFQIFDKEVRRIKGKATGRYLLINSRGRLTSTLLHSRNTFFKENFEENNWCSYRSMNLGYHCGLHPQPSMMLQEWFVAIKENGYLRRPCKTLPGMKATHFFVLTPEEVQDLLVTTQKN